jgi:hypothetical protein
MSLKFAKFNVEDKKNLAMDKEFVFQDDEVESSKVDDAILDAMVSVNQLKVEVLVLDT